MNVEELRQYCLSKPATTESFPFDEVTLVFKVAGKMFALIGLDNPDLSINLKCDPNRAIELRQQYSSIAPGYHMNKNHWNTVQINGELHPEMIRNLIDHSYELIVNSLTKKTRTQFNL